MPIRVWDGLLSHMSIYYILIWDNKPSHTHTGILYEYTRMGRPIRV